MELQLEELEASATVPPALPRTPAARADRRARLSGMRMLRWCEPGQAGRGHHRDVGSHSPAVASYPDGAKEIYLPRLRAHQPAAGAVPCHPSWLGRPQSSGHDHVREIRSLFGPMSKLLHGARPIVTRWGASCRVPTMWPKQWTICSSAGRCLRSIRFADRSLTTAASA